MSFQRIGSWLVAMIRQLGQEDNDREPSSPSAPLHVREEHMDKPATALAPGYRLHLTSPTWTRGSETAAHLWRPLPPRAGELDSARRRSPEQRTGAWTLIEEHDGGLRLSTDRARSHHLLFARAGGTWLVSDDPQELRRLVPSWRRDEAAAEVFLHTGFTVGTATLVRGVRATPAGAVVELRPDGTWSSRPWEAYRYDPEPITAPEEFSVVFRDALDAAVERVLRDAGDRRLLVPLSGGLDSRLLAAWLKRHGARNAAAFTYGAPGSAEAAVSRDVAGALGLDWFCVELDPAEVARAWAGPDGADFQERTWGAISLPHVQDWYALLTMRERGLVDADAVFLPGHTIVGNMHDEHLLDGAPPRARVLTAVAAHHSPLQGEKDAWRRLPQLRREVVRAADEVSFPGGARSVQELIEWFNLRERQAKYINASMKAYEAFGYGWALPMLDVEVWRAWLRGSQELTATRQWYERFTAEAFAEATGTAMRLFETPAERIPAAPRRLLLAALRATGMRTAVARALSVRTMLRHPMAFEAFNEPMPLPEQLVRMARGASSPGLWTRLFLEGTWGTRPVVPPA